MRSGTDWCADHLWLRPPTPAQLGPTLDPPIGKGQGSRHRAGGITIIESSTILQIYIASPQYRDTVMDKTEFLSSWSFLRNKRRWTVNKQREKVIGRDKS